MMNKLSRVALSISLALAMSATHADDVLNQNPYAEESNANLKKIAEYIQNLGSFLGYDVTQTGPSSPVSTLLANGIELQGRQMMAFFIGLSSLPVNSLMKPLVPKSVPGADLVNGRANANFQSYANSDQQNGQVAVSSLIDQPEFQQDPVNQSILNILGTPSYTYCMTWDGSQYSSENCQKLQGKNIKTNNQVATNVIGDPLPNTQEFYTFDKIQSQLSQLNANSLTGPLMYTADAPTSTGSSGGSGEGQPAGLTAQNQAQAAANFIRYATGQTLPIPLPKMEDYNSLYTTAYNDQNATETQKQAAKATIANYLSSLRVYSAQSSVGASNLYYILSKRIPNTQVTADSKPTSQALSEFMMATSRLFNPAIQDPDKQWLSTINSASEATVQKEMVVLLAEINYQLYLNRQQEERILLTNSILLLQNARNNPPPEDLANNSDTSQAQQ